MAVSLAFLALLAGVPAAFADEQDYCATDAPVITLFIDVTTPYDDIDKKSLVEGVSAIYSSLKGGERFSIRTIADAFSSSEKLIEHCIPYCPEVGFLEGLFSKCTRGVVINDSKKLKASIRERLADRLANFVELPKSDVIRTIAMAAREVVNAKADNRIFIFSDMIDNSDVLRGGKLFSLKNDALLKLLKSDDLIPDLRGADVHVFGIGRSGDPANRAALDPKRFQKLSQFWTLYFAAAGATATIQQNLAVE